MDSVCVVRTNAALSLCAILTHNGSVTSEVCQLSQSDFILFHIITLHLITLQ